MEPDELYLGVEELFRSGRKTSVAEDVRRAIEEECGENALDQDLLRYQENWSFLAARIVGAEGV